MTERLLSKEEAITPKALQKGKLLFVVGLTDKDHHFWKNVLWSDETKITALAQINAAFGAKVTELARIRTLSQLRSMAVAGSCCLEVLVNKIDSIIRQHHK